MSESEVRIEVAQRIATITIDREARRNALSPRVIEALSEAITSCSRREDVGVIVLTGAGEKMFCAGGDLGDGMMREGALSMHHARGEFATLMVAMQRCARPIIGRVNGHALGGGFGLAMSCDLVVASEAASFGMPEIKVGLFPMMIMAVVVRNLGRKRAMEMMLTGERISAAQAREWGVVNVVAAPEELDARVAELAEKVASYSPAVLRLGREAFYGTQDMSFEQALGMLQSQLTLNTLAEDAAEGVTAFMEKRAPQWKGR